MKKNISTFLLLLATGLSFAQQITCAPQDLEAFSKKTTEIKDLTSKELGPTLVAVGKTFKGTPYVAKTLEIGETETLVVNLTGLDCTTFVENVLAFSILVHEDKLDYNSFTKTLEKIRYKDGKLNGYASRLHYFSEWIANNEKKGLLKDITTEIGGVETQKTSIS